MTDHRPEAERLLAEREIDYGTLVVADSRVRGALRGLLDQIAAMEAERDTALKQLDLYKAWAEGLIDALSS